MATKSRRQRRAEDRAERYLRGQESLFREEERRERQTPRVIRPAAKDSGGVPSPRAARADRVGVRGWSVPSPQSKVGRALAWVFRPSPARVLEAGWLLAVLLVPLIFYPAGRDSYELPK